MGREERTLPPTFLVAAGSPAEASAGAGGVQEPRVPRPRGWHRLGFGCVPPWCALLGEGKVSWDGSLSGKAKERGRGKREKESDLIHCRSDHFLLHWQKALQIPFIQLFRTTRGVDGGCRGALQGSASSSALKQPRGGRCVCAEGMGVGGQVAGRSGGWRAET